MSIATTHCIFVNELFNIRTHVRLFRVLFYCSISWFLFNRSNFKIFKMKTIKTITVFVAIIATLVSTQTWKRAKNYSLFIRMRDRKFIRNITP